MIFKIAVAFTCLWFLLAYSRSIYKYFILPKRSPDLEHNCFQYWFDEMIAYSEIFDVYYNLANIIHNNKPTLIAVSADRMMNERYLDEKVQEAFRQHVHSKFEDIVLEN